MDLFNKIENNLAPQLKLPFSINITRNSVEVPDLFYYGSRVSAPIEHPFFTVEMSDIPKEDGDIIQLILEYKARDLKLNYFNAITPSGFEADAYLSLNFSVTNIFGLKYFVDKGYLEYFIGDALNGDRYLRSWYTNGFTPSRMLLGPPGKNENKIYYINFEGLIAETDSSNINLFERCYWCKNIGSSNIIKRTKVLDSLNFIIQCDNSYNYDIRQLLLILGVNENKVLGYAFNDSNKDVIVELHHNEPKFKFVQSEPDQYKTSISLCSVKDRNNYRRLNKFSLWYLLNNKAFLWFKGNENGRRYIKDLELLGAKNIDGLEGLDNNKIYYIDTDCILKDESLNFEYIFRSLKIYKEYLINMENKTEGFKIIKCVFTERKLNAFDTEGLREFVFICDNENIRVGDLVTSPQYNIPLQITEICYRSSRRFNGVELKTLMIDKINNINNQISKQRMNKKNSMISKVVEAYKSQFIPQKEDGLRLSLEGVICCRVAEGEYQGISNDDTVIKYPETATMSIPIYSIVKKNFDVKIGDIVKYKNTYAKVKSIDKKTGTFKCIDFNGHEISRKEVKDYLMGTTTTKVIVNMFNINPSEGGFNPLFFAMAEDDFDIKDLMMMSALGGGNGMFNGQGSAPFNPMLMMLMSKSEEGESKDSLLETMMMMSMFGGNNPFGNMFNSQKPTESK